MNPQDASIEGIASARELCRRCYDCDPFKWIRGGVDVNYHTLSDFRTSNPQWLKEQVVTNIAATRAEERYPVSHGAELGPTDLHTLLRGHTESILDLMDEPGKSAELLMHLGHLFVEFFAESWKRLPLYRGGYFDAQYQLWAPEPIIRMQEDATAVFSPHLYRKLVQPVDRMIAGRFACNFIHLHSTSMFMLGAFLEIEELRCFEINIEPFNIPVEGMIEYFTMVQEADRPLLIRGSFTEDEIRLVMDSLDPRGLLLHIMPKDKEEIGVLRPILGM